MMDRRKMEQRMGNDPNLTPEVKNPEVEERLTLYGKEKSGENLERLMEALKTARMLMPANMGSDGRPALCVIETPKKERLFSAYTCKERIPKESKNTVIVNMPFPSISQMVIKSEGQISGIILNPFSDNLVLTGAFLKKFGDAKNPERETEPKGMQLTQNQYAVFERRQFESVFFPKQFFERGQELINELCEKKEEYIDQLFEEAYEEKRMYPYLPEDFSVMVMNISEELLLVRIDLPNKDWGENSCERVYLAWNELTQKGRYFMIERTQDRKVKKFCELDGDWKRNEYGEAPAEGMELPTIIDLCKKV